MSTEVLHAGGEALQEGEYLGNEIKLMFRFIETTILNSPEISQMSEQDIVDLHSVSHVGIDDLAAYKRLSKNPFVSYLCNYWVRNFSACYGCLARIDGQPLETVTHEINWFQNAVSESVSKLRFHWWEKTNQILPLQTAFEHVRWNGPRIDEVSDGEGFPRELFFKLAALFPHVVQGDDSITELMFQNGKIHPEVFSRQIRWETREAIEKEIDIYEGIR